MAHYSLASIGLLASLRAAMCAVKSCVVSVVIALFPPAGIDIMCWLVHYQGTNAMAHYSLASIGLLASLRAAMCAVKSCVVSVVIALFPPAGIDIMCWLVHYQGTKCNGTLFPCKHRSSGQLASCYVCSQILCCERCDCFISTSRDWHHVLTGPLSRNKMHRHRVFADLLENKVDVKTAFWFKF